MLTAEQTEELKLRISELGGMAFKEEDIIYEGNKMVVPEQWRGDLKKAVRFLNDKIKEEDEQAEFSRNFSYRPFDGAICAFRALKKAFGMVQGKPTYTWFGKQPPSYIQVPVSATETEEVPWGQFTIPLLEGASIYFQSGTDKEIGPVFNCYVVGPRKHRFLVEGMFKLMEEEMRQGSIYRGSAIDGQTTPQFLDLSSLDRSRVVYSEQVQADLEAHIWSVMRYSEQHRALGLPLKRSILLYGPYGTGKSLAGYLTAREAVEHHWTFIMARPGRDDFLSVMQTARLYQPAVVFFEDAETVTASEQTSTESISKVLDTFDGIQSKGTQLMVVMTTNHPDNIHKAMHRPGRVDAQIEIGSLDASGIRALIQANIREDMLADNIDWDAVGDANVDYVPAFVKESADRAIRYALSRSGGDITDGSVSITTEDLVHAAAGLRAQYARMVGAAETRVHEKTLTELVKDSAGKGVASLASKGTLRADVWDQESVHKAQNGSH